LSSRVLENPWMFAYEVINKGLISDAVDSLKELLREPSDSREFIAGLELIKALKSLGRPELTDKVFQEILTEDLVRRVYRELKPELIVEGFRKSYGLGMAYLTFLEILIPKLGSNESLELTKHLMSNAISKLRPEDLREFMRGLIYGPLAVLKPLTIKALIRAALEVKDGSEILLLKAEYLTSLVRVHPPTYFTKGIALEMGLLLKDIIKEALSLVDRDQITAERIYNEVSIFLSEMNAVCRELRDWEPCDNMTKTVGNDLIVFYRVMGERFLGEVIPKI